MPIGKLADVVQGPVQLIPGGLDAIEPPAAPAPIGRKLTDSVSAIGTNCAVTLVDAALSVSKHSPVPEHPPPVHPAKLDCAAGEALRVTRGSLVVLEKSAEHVAPQSIAPLPSVTVPLPVPLFETDSCTESWPVPVSVAEAWPPLMFSTDRRDPWLGGSNCTVTSHDIMAPSGLPLHPSWVMANPELTPAGFKVADKAWPAVPTALVTVNACVGPWVPASVVANANEVGEMDRVEASAPLSTSAPASTPGSPLSTSPSVVWASSDPLAPAFGTSPSPMIPVHATTRSDTAHAIARRSRVPLMAQKLPPRDRPAPAGPTLGVSTIPVVVAGRAEPPSVR